MLPDIGVAFNRTGEGSALCVRAETPPVGAIFAGLFYSINHILDKENGRAREHLLDFKPSPLWFYVTGGDFLYAENSINGGILLKPLVTWLLSYRPKQCTATPSGEFE